MTGERVKVDCASLVETNALAALLAKCLRPDTVIAMVGPMGAGKTHFVRAAVEALGGDPRKVSSPTFTLIHEYDSRLPVFHFDTYRLASESAFSDLGVHEYFESRGICLIEWGDRVPGVLPADHLRLTIEPTGETTRRMTFEATGPIHAEILRQLVQEMGRRN